MCIRDSIYNARQLVQPLPRSRGDGQEHQPLFLDERTELRALLRRRDVAFVAQHDLRPRGQLLRKDVYKRQALRRAL